MNTQPFRMRVNTRGMIALALLLSVLLPVAATAALTASTLANPCEPGASYNQACDVDHDGDVDVMDVQLSAGHWNQSGTFNPSDNNHNHLGQTWTGSSSIPLRIEGSFPLPDYAALVLSNSTGFGMLVGSTGNSGVVVSSAGNRGLYVNSAGGDGVYVGSAGHDGVDATSTGAAYFGGRFSNQAAGGGGVYARGGDNSAADVILGGTSSADDGRIYSEPSLTGSDILLFTNDEAQVHLDEDNNSTSAFTIFNGTNASVWSVGESGMAVAAGPSAVQVEAGAEGQRLAYAVTSPQNWVEDFGSGQLLDGEAVIALETAYAEAVSADQPYHVFLTPLGDCLLYVAEKAAASFTVSALGGEKCSVAFDYRIVALRRGYETVRMEQFVEVTDE